MMPEEIELTISAQLNENDQIMFADEISDIFDLMDEKYPDMPIETQITLLESSRLFFSLKYNILYIFFIFSADTLEEVNGLYRKVNNTLYIKVWFYYQHFETF